MVTYLELDEIPESLCKHIFLSFVKTPALSSAPSTSAPGGIEQNGKEMTLLGRIRHESGEGILKHGLAEKLHGLTEKIHGLSHNTVHINSSHHHRHERSASTGANVISAVQMDGIYSRKGLSSFPSVSVVFSSVLSSSCMFLV